MCLYTQLMYNKKYEKNKKNGGVIPAIRDKRVLAVPIPCGKCIECMKKRAREWQIRLYEEIKVNKNGIFTTLTFNNESLLKLKRKIKKQYKSIEGYELDNAIAKEAVKLFLERWRRKHKKSVRHWLVTELGHNGTERIHLHGIIFTDKSPKEIEKRWGYGYVWAGYESKPNYINEQTINYITKYITKTDIEHKEYKPVILTSAGIGREYIKGYNATKNAYKENDTKETYTTKSGHEIMLNTYYRKKLYNDEEREKLWLEKLDKNERYVCGEKVDTTEGEEEYWKLVEYYKAKNERLGYGNNEMNYNRKREEAKRREMLYQQINNREVNKELKENKSNTQNGLLPSASF